MNECNVNKDINGVDIIDFEGVGYKPAVKFEAWRVAYLRYSDAFDKIMKLERHNETDEVFVLLEGQATLYAWDEKGAMQALKMEDCKVYNVPRGTWHHIVVSRDATVLVVENSNTVKENTERRELTEC